MFTRLAEGQRFLKGGGGGGIRGRLSRTWVRPGSTLQSLKPYESVRVSTACLASCIPQARLTPQAQTLNPQPYALNPNP